MKTMLLGVVAVVLGVGGGAFFSGLKVKEQLLTEAVQAAADSAAAAHLIEEVAQAADLPETGAIEVVPASDGGADPLDPLVQQHDVAEAQPDEAATGSDMEQVAEATAAPTPVEDTPSAAEAERLAEEGARKLSKIFGAMQAQDAAAVLQEMTDDEIELILKHMSDRLAAQILGVFEPARAASLSRVVLGSRPGP